MIGKLGYCIFDILDLEFEFVEFYCGILEGWEIDG